jgi:NADH-quinone oxidoreductase subunit L
LNAEESGLEHWLHHAMPTSVLADFGQVPGHDEPSAIPFKDKKISERYQAHAYHDLAGMLALGVVALGFAFAGIVYYWRVLDPAEAKEQFPGVHRFLSAKWYFDELYSVALVRPALVVANWCRSFDLGIIDGFVHAIARVGVFLAWVHGLSDRYIVDGLVNVTAGVFYAVGSWLRNIQTGYIRSYVLFLVLAAVGIWILLTYFLGVPPAAVGGPP